MRNAVRNKLATTLLATLAFTSGYKYWLLSKDPSVRIFNIIGVVFILIIAVRVFVRNEKIRVGNGITYVYLWWGWLLLVVLSSVITVIISPESKSLSQLTIGFLIVFQKCSIITCIYIFFKSSSFNSKKFVFWAYLIGALVSALYVYFQLFVFLNGYNVDVEVWNFLSYGSPWDRESMVSEYFYGGFFRFSGVSGPQPQSYYIATAVPLFVGLFSEYRNKIYLFISVMLSMGLVLTFSRSGGLALFVSLSTFTIVSYLKGKKQKFLVRSLFLPFLLILTSLVLYLLYMDTVNTMVQARLESSARVKFYGNMTELLGMYPFGVGYNNFSVMYSEYFLKESFNPHSSWFRYLLELGPIGLFYRFIFFCYIIFSLYRSGSSFLSIALISSVTGLSVAALFNMVFDIFFVHIFLTIGYLYAIESDNF